MRPYRAWDIEAKEMRHIITDMHFALHGLTYIKWMDENTDTHVLRNDETCVGGKRRFILEQSTGLKDKNSKEAYRGDLIQHDKTVYEIKWCDEGMGFYCDGNEWIEDARLIRRSIIIATIHDNPELLNEAKK